MCSPIARLRAIFTHSGGGLTLATLVASRNHGLGATLVSLMLAACGAMPAGPSAHAAADDPRILVKFPDAMRVHTLTNMRDHLLVMSQIQEELSRGAFDAASELAEQQLGMSSLGLHGAHDAAQFMPEGMQAAGTAMHRSASRFAIVAKDASVTGDVKASLAALAKVSQACVACHATYRIQ